ncbi:hypothetical protein CEXT_605731 [Caerostris extrusa]|uniref:Transmembrane protein n=1 Tax=Caerostris extrusa TaxID=172846 RepID=A0AAV4P729_CAEEX|nr:hypothetical protein CEXT_605731 [Caerostris extrusa]
MLIKGSEFPRKKHAGTCCPRRFSARNIPIFFHQVCVGNFCGKKATCMTGSPDRSRCSRASHHPPTEGKVKAKAAFAEEHPFHFKNKLRRDYLSTFCMRLLSLSYLSIGRNGIVVFILFFLFPPIYRQLLLLSSLQFMLASTFYCDLDNECRCSSSVKERSAVRPLSA